MKTEDIDKKIGMPDVDAEWAKFEREVIGKEETPSHKRVVLWGLSIAASIALIAGIFLFGKGADEQADTMVAVAEKAVASSIPEADAATPLPEDTLATKEATKDTPKYTPKTKQTLKTRQHSGAGQLAMTTSSDTKKEETSSANQTTEESVKVFSSVEQAPSYPGGYRALQEFLKTNKRYDGLAQEYGANGRVITTCLIDSLGYISDVKVQRCLLKYDTLRLNRETQEMQQQVKQQIVTQLGDESKRLVSLMPRWIPGKMYGRSRNVRYTMPIQFP